VPEFPQLVAYGTTREEATQKAEMLALLALAEKRFRFGRGTSGRVRQQPS